MILSTQMMYSKGGFKQPKVCLKFFSYSSQQSDDDYIFQFTHKYKSQYNNNTTH